MVRANGTQEARVILVIETIAKRGLGTEKDPERLVRQYWDLDGKFLAEMDLEHCIPIIEHEARVTTDLIDEIKKERLQTTGGREEPKHFIPEDSIAKYSSDEEGQNYED